jgi:DNA-binding NtrC family response regulator
LRPIQQHAAGRVHQWISEIDGLADDRIAKAPRMSASRPEAHQVLVVDDEDDVREAIAAILSLEGYAVAAASGVDDAFRQIRDGFRPCVVLLDLHMPGLDGWVFVERMRSERSLVDVSVVIVSGTVDQQARAVARGYDFLVKPMDGQTIIAAVKCHCAHHRS